MALSEKYMKTVIILISVWSICGQTCTPTVTTIGYTVPQGDITIRYGEPLNITCNLYKEVLQEYGPNASARLYFIRNNKPVAKDMVTIVNSTSINLFVPYHPKTKEDKYYCNFSGKKAVEMICMNVVYVGVPPQNVTDFSCLGRNYVNLTCSWTPPENYISTNYTLTYNVNSRSARKHKNKGYRKCFPDEHDWDTLRCFNIKTLENGKKSCFWSLNTSPQYRPVHECYYFAITMTNALGQNKNFFTFDHFKRIVPDPPANLTAVATSPHSIKLSWAVPRAMVTFEKGFDHRILYLCQYYKAWQIGGLISHLKNDTLTYELTGLKYAHLAYDIRVSIRISGADVNDESMWSNNASKIVRTDSKRPDCPPKISIGNFECINGKTSRNVYIYWHQIKEEQQNGENLAYLIKLPNGSSIQSDKSFALLQNLSYTEYVIHIWSSNSVGPSEEKSTLVIPAKPLSKPSNFDIYEHNGQYYVSWQPPKDEDSADLVTSYSIYWCVNRAPNQCAENLYWDEVSKESRSYKLTLPSSRIYQFAISANSPNSSSGMLWSECIRTENRLGKVASAWATTAGPDYIELGWTLDCLNRINSIQGFIIFYCAVVSTEQTVCRNGTERNFTIPGDVNLRYGKVTGLTPCTSYRLTVSYILNNATYSLPSDPVRNCTREGAPPPPRNVTIYSVTNSSISVRWQEPEVTKCYLKTYYVYYNDKKINSTEKDITITDLMSYKDYSISVSACSVVCSEHSEPQMVRTEMWSPGKINQPQVVSQNESYITFYWDRPNPPRGEVNYYQIKFKEQHDEENPKIVNVTNQNYTLSCALENSKLLYISVRAVNIINGHHKAGPWSYDLQSPCVSHIYLLYIFLGVLLIFFFIVMVYAFIWLYRWINKEKKFDPILPPGLQPVPNWNSEKIKDIAPNPPTDSQHLLQKGNETHVSGDSSGCSSGHESITSSLESTAHISPSDSGTEQPRSPSLNEDNRKNSLRLRNVSAVPRPTINLGYVPADTLPLANLIPKPLTPSAGNYCMLGVDPSNTGKSDSPYVPITDLNTKLPFPVDLTQPPPYVRTGDLVKSTNPGYVPYTTTEPADKNTGYVVAGLPKDLLAPDLRQCNAPKSVVNEEMPLYVKASDPLPSLKPHFPWQQPAPQLSLPKSGYVSVGDAPPPKTLTEVTKGYVPHRQFEGKSLKED